LAKKLAELAIRRQSRNSGLLVGIINEKPAREHFLARFLEEAGFVNTVLGFQMRRVNTIAAPTPTPTPVDDSADDDDVDDEPQISESA
jgi:hypothetical protein